MDYLPSSRRRIFTFYILFIALFSLSANAQNLVPNPGFEDYYNCPQSISEVPSPGAITYGVKNWTVPGAGTSDYYNACGAGIVGVPQNIFGYQQAHGGNAYVGMITMLYYLHPNSDTYREYVETQLAQPLKKNNLYNVSFYVNTAATDGLSYLGGQDYSFWATDGIGAYLSGSYVYGYNLFAFTPQVQQPAGQIITDTAGWTLVSGYMAGNGEDYIVIGNFKKYLQMVKSPVMQTAAPSPNGVYDTISYVYVDDVSVTPVTDATNDTSLCDTVGFSKVLHGYQGGSNYTWNTGDTTPQIIVHTPGTYTYQVTFGSYTIKDTINITYRTRQQLHANLHDTAICAGTTINIKAPDSFVAYEWHANGNVYHTQTVPVFTAGTVVLQATDSCGMMTDSFHVRFIQQQPLAAHINDTMVCAGTNVQFAAPAGYLAYQWHYGNTATTGQSVTITQPGTVILQVSDSCKTYADTFIIHHKQPLPLIHLHDTTICNGATAFVMAQNGYDAYGWQYSGNTYTTQAVMITNAGKVVLHVTDICGTQADSFMVAYKQLYPLTTHLHDTSVCAGTSVQVTAPAGYLSYAWLHDNTVDTKQAATIASDGMVILQVQDSCVTYADSFIVQLKPVPLPPATTDTAICPGAILVSLPVYGSGLLWYTSPSDKNGSVTMPVVPSGQHDPLIIYVTQTVNGCESDKASLRIDFYNEPVVILPTDTVFCSGDRYRIGYEANMPVSYKWSSGETVPFIYPAASGVYQLTVSNMCGSAAASTNMQVAPCDKCFWLPDAFTPNGDGRNDEFGPVRTCPAHFHYYLFKVYNRWGQVVFESVSPEHKWNGSFAGQDQPLGTYSYTLEYRSTAVSPTVFTKGTLELIR